MKRIIEDLKNTIENKVTENNMIPLSKLIVYGNCPKCGGYLINTMDDFSAFCGAEPNVKCQNCGHHATDVEDEIRRIGKLSGGMSFR